MTADHIPSPPAPLSQARFREIHGIAGPERLSRERLAEYAALDFTDLMGADAAAVVGRMRDLLVGEIVRLNAERAGVVDVPLPDLERQIAELRAHALQHLAERGEQPTAEHWVQWHDFLDIDPDLHGRDYNPTPKEATA